MKFAIPLPMTNQLQFRNVGFGSAQPAIRAALGE